jgi:hypothetical protein
MLQYGIDRHFSLSDLEAIKNRQHQHRQSNEEASSPKCYLPAAPKILPDNYRTNQKTEEYTEKSSGIQGGLNIQAV